MKICLLLLAVVTLSGCASSLVALRLTPDGTPAAVNISGRQLTNCNFRAVAISVDGRTAIADENGFTWDSGLSVELPKLRMDGIVGIQLQGTYDGGKLRAKWTLPGYSL